MCHTQRGLSDCVLMTRICYAKTAEPIRCSFGIWLSGSKEPCIRWRKDRTNPFETARGDKSVMRPFAKLLWTLVTTTTTTTTTAATHQAKSDTVPIIKWLYLPASELSISINTSNKSKRSTIIWSLWTAQPYSRLRWQRQRSPERRFTMDVGDDGLIAELNDVTRLNATVVRRLGWSALRAPDWT